MQSPEQSERRFVPFLLAFLVTLLIMVGVLAAAVIWHGRPAAPMGEGPLAAGAAAPALLPRPEEQLTLLLAGAEDAGNPPEVFLLAGFLPDKGRISLCLLPPKTIVGTGERQGTLEELFARGGAPYAAKAVGEFLGLSVTRSAYMEVAGLKKVMERAGSYDYFLPVTLDYPVHRRPVNLHPGMLALDGRRMADLLLYPAYAGGEVERSDRGVMLITQLVNHHLPDCNTEAGDALVKAFLNNTQTDLSYKDWEERKSAARFLAALELPAATAVYVEGTLNQDSTAFVLTESCRTRIAQAFCGTN